MSHLQQNSKKTHPKPRTRSARTADAPLKPTYKPAAKGKRKTKASEPTASQPMTAQANGSQANGKEIKSWTRNTREHKLNGKVLCCFCILYFVSMYLGSQTSMAYDY